MRTVYFKEVKSIEGLRKQYKSILKKHHPDNGGDGESIKEINIEYERLFDDLRRFETSGKGNTADEFTNEDMAIRKALNSIIGLDINIELCGTWIWVTGNTYTVKEVLKEQGFKWSKNKKAWYWHGEGFVKYGKKKYSLNDIRNKYGSETIKTKEQVFIGA